MDKRCVSTPSFTSLINGSFNAPPFFMRLQQGNPLSPLLFNLVMEVFNRILLEAREANVIMGPSVGNKERNKEVTYSFAMTLLSVLQAGQELYTSS